MSSINRAGKLDNHMHKIKLDPCLIPFTKITSTWVKGLNIRHETIKTIGENIGEKLFDISLSNKFLDMTPKA